MHLFLALGKGSGIGIFFLGAWRGKVPFSFGGYGQPIAIFLEQPFAENVRIYYCPLIELRSALLPVPIISLRVNALPIFRRGFWAEAHGDFFFMCASMGFWFRWLYHAPAASLVVGAYIV